MALLWNFNESSYLLHLLSACNIVTRIGSIGAKSNVQLEHLIKDGYRLLVLATTPLAVREDNVIIHFYSDYFPWSLIIEIFSCSN